MNNLYMLMIIGDGYEGHTESCEGVFFEKCIAEQAARIFIAKLQEKLPGQTKISDADPLKLYSVSGLGCGWCHWTSIRCCIQEIKPNMLLSCINDYVDPLEE